MIEEKAWAVLDGDGINLDTVSYAGIDSIAKWLRATTKISFISGPSHEGTMRIWNANKGACRCVRVKLVEVESDEY